MLGVSSDVSAMIRGDVSTPVQRCPDMCPGLMLFSQRLQLALDLGQIGEPADC
jgi:hypothetical protein